MSDHAELMRSIRTSMKSTSSITPDSLDWSNLPGKPILKASNRPSSQELIGGVERAICSTREALCMSPPGHIEHAKLLNVLGFELGRRYSYKCFKSRVLKKTVSRNDLTESVEVIQQAIDMTPATDTNRLEMHYNLSVQLAKVYLVTKDPADLDDAICNGREAVCTATEMPRNRAYWSIHLADNLYARYNSVGKLCDLEEAIGVVQRAIEASGPGATRIRLQDMLGDFLIEQVERTSDITYLDRAIIIARSISRTTSIGYAHGGERLMQLARLLQIKYSRTGSTTCLDEAIHVVQEAVDAMRTDFPLGIERLNVLGNLLIERHSRTGAEADIDDAIAFHKQAVETSLPTDSGYISFLNDLGVALGERYIRIKSSADLNEAVRVSQNALERIEKSHEISLQAYRNRATILANLGKYLGWLYSETNDLQKLEDAIQAHRKAIEPFSEGGDQKGRPGRLGNLGALLGTRFRRLGDLNDVEEAICAIREAMRLTTDAHPDHAQLLHTLGELLEDRFSRSERTADIEEASFCYRSALHQQNAPTLVRILAGKDALDCAASMSNWEQAFEDSATVIQLIPKLNVRSLEQYDKQYVLGQIATLACSATAIALQADMSPGQALSFLELGRGLLSASIEETRADMLNLQLSHPDLAEQFVRLQTELQQPIYQPDTLAGNSGESMVQARATRRFELSNEIDDLIELIRKVPEYKDFLLPPQELDMQRAAEHGPIVVINVSPYRCDVLLVEPNQIRNIHLAKLKLDDIKRRATQNDLGNIQVLEWLWDTLAQPTLDALGYLNTPMNGQWPHIWWIPTGLLTKFPLHSAGYHALGSSATVLDRVYSSYSASVTALIHGRRSRNTGEPSKQSRDHALLVAMPQTTGHSQLQYAVQELKALGPICEAMGHRLIQNDNRKQQVVSKLLECNIFHFAGHGYTDDHDPSQSSLLLEDWMTDRFTVSTLFTLNLRSRAPFLAYLSACGTGEVKDERFFDESLHLIRAFQLAGFRHVIGTLWEVNDANCVKMARLTYEGIRDGDMTDAAVCIGLHKATVELRNCWLDERSSGKHKEASTKEGSDDVLESRRTSTNHDKVNNRKDRAGRKWVLDDSEDDFDVDHTPPLWVPYVHFGV